jgi:signal transduction histidine kinase/Flp pilus assembly protein TadD
MHLADKMTYTDLDESARYYKEAYKLSKDLGYPFGMAESLYQIGLYFKKYKNEADSSLPYANRAIYISDSLHYLRILVKSYRLKSICLRSKGNDSEMRNYALKCLAISRELDDSVGIGKVYSELGMISMEESKYDSAAFWYMKALDIYEKAGQEKLKGTTYINLARNYVKTDDYELAEKYLLRALNIKDKLWRRTYIAIVYDNLGIIYSDRQDHNKAIDYYDQGIEQALQTNNKGEYANLLVNKSVSLRKMGLFHEGKEDLKKALKVSREIGYVKINHDAVFNLASIYAEQGLYRKAIAYYDSALLISKNMNKDYLLLVNYQNQSPIYAALGDYKNAFHYQSLYFNLKDSLYKLEKMETINDLELKYQKKENEAKILGLENENLRKDVSIRKKTAQRNMVTYTALGIFIIVVFLFAYYRQRVRKNRIITQQKIKQLEEEKKLLAARSLVEGQEEERKRIAKDLHDGIGVLLSTARMQFTALKDKNPENNALVDKAGKLLEQASVDVRRISHNMMPGLLTKYGLNEAIADLFEQLDDTPGLSAKMDTNEETKRLAENQEIMLYRIVQELVNNTLKHARAKNISLILDYTGDKLGLRYADDGVGFDMGEKTKTVSIGMKGIESRVSFLGGEVNIESAKGKGLHCHIEVPVEYRGSTS